VSVPSARPFRLRSVALTAYGPTVVASTGHGAVMPVLALRARDLGADVATAAFVVALLGVGMLLASLPAGALVARVGERRTLLLGGLVDGAALLAAALTTSLAVLGGAVVVSGMAWTAFLIARQGYMIDAVPTAYRARAMSVLGGSHRVGLLLGPLLGAALIGLTDLRAAFVLAATLTVAAGLLALAMPDLGTTERAAARAGGHATVLSVLREHRRTLLTLGTAVVVIGASRSVRTVLLPLWAEQVGLSAATTSLVLAVAAAVDIAFFLPGGWLMDTRGRTVVAVPVVLTVALGCLLLPTTSGVAGLTAVACLMALGNGLGSGIVMTLGADAAPVTGRAQFLGGWRLCGDIGSTGGPVLVGVVASVAPLATAAVVIGVLGLAGTAWVARWTRRVDRGVLAG
jgi:MFS family permease